MELHVFGETTLFRVGIVPVTETMVASLAVALGLIACGVALGLSVRRRPESRASAVAFLTVEWLEGLVHEVTGRTGRPIVVLCGTLFLYIAAANLSGLLPGVHQRPTASLAATSALACVVFLAVPVAGIAARGLRRYLGGYLRPNPLLLPLHVVAEVSRTVALSVRLFGNMMSAQLVVALLVALTGVLVPMPLMALDLLIGLLQAYIFTVLAVVYIGAAVRASEE